VSVSTESEQSAGQGYPPTWTLRSYDIPVSLSMDTSVWWSGDLFSAMRTTLGADRSREHYEAHAKGDTVTNCHLRADQVVEWATRGGAKGARPRRRGGRAEAGDEGRRRADQERPVAGDVPAHQPVRARGVPGPARGRAHGLVNGKVVKHEHELVGIDLGAARREVESTVDFLRGALGEQAWANGMNPDVPETTILDNPYQYTGLLVREPPTATEHGPRTRRHRRVPVPTGVARSQLRECRIAALNIRARSAR
jgi:hypothetical protein